MKRNVLLCGGTDDSMEMKSISVFATEAKIEHRIEMFVCTTSANLFGYRPGLKRIIDAQLPGFFEAGV